MTKKLVCMFVIMAVLLTLGINTFAATVGQQLLSPEAGWQRYDDTCELIQYQNCTIGRRDISDFFYQGTVSYPNDKTGTISFKFTGDKLRILGDYCFARSTQIKISVDGNIETFSAYTSGAQIPCGLLYEKMGLLDTTHEVIISTDDLALPSPNYMVLDAIDISSTGSLLNSYVPNTPTALTAAASNAKVDLSWAATSGSAITYNVKRSTTPSGIYTTIATSSAISYTDNSVTNGITYYYVVSAVDSTGESGNSNEASATPTAPTEPPVISGNKAILEISIINGTEKEYDLTASELQSFLTWYDGRSEGTGKAYYTFTKKSNIKPFLSRKEYIAYDKIDSFEVKDYNE